MKWGRSREVGESRSIAVDARSIDDSRFAETEGVKRLKLGVLGSGRGSNFVALAAAVAEGKVAAEFVVVGSDQADAKILEEAKKRESPRWFVPRENILRNLRRRLRRGWRSRW